MARELSRIYTDVYALQEGAGAGGGWILMECYDYRAAPEEH